MKTKSLMTFSLILIALGAMTPAAHAFKCCKIKIRIRPPNPIDIVLPPVVKQILPPEVRKPIEKVEKEIKKIDPTPTVVIGGTRVIDVQGNREAEQNLKSKLIDPVMKPIERNRAIIEKMSRVTTCLRTACLSEYMAQKELRDARKKEERAYRSYIEAEKNRQNAELSAEEAQKKAEMREDAAMTFVSSQTITARAEVSNVLGKAFGQLLLSEIQNRELKVTVQQTSAEHQVYQTKLRELMTATDISEGGRLESLYAEFEMGEPGDQIVKMQTLLQSAADEDLRMLKEQRAKHLGLVNEAAAAACEEGLTALEVLAITGGAPSDGDKFRQFCNGGH